MALIALTITLSQTAALSAQTPQTPAESPSDSVLTLLSDPTPVYPEAARAAHTSGTVEFTGTVAKSGEITYLNVVNADQAFRASVIDTVTQWKYKPFLENNVDTDVAVKIVLHYSFNAAGEPQVHTEQQVDLNTTPKKFDSGIIRPRVTFQVEPKYTKKDGKANRKGSLLISMWVDEQGKPFQVSVVRGLGNILDDKAVDAVRQYKFVPATEDGKPVLVRLKIEVNFQIF